jgi:hypothetical protein
LLATLVILATRQLCTDAKPASEARAGVPCPCLSETNKSNKDHRTNESNQTNASGIEFATRSHVQRKLALPLSRIERTTCVACVDVAMSGGHHGQDMFCSCRSTYVQDLSRISISESLVYLNLKGLEEDGEYLATDFHACLACKLAGPLPKVVGSFSLLSRPLDVGNRGWRAAAGLRSSQRRGGQGGGPGAWCWWRLFCGVEMLLVWLHGLVRNGSRDLAALD